MNSHAGVLNERNPNIDYREMKGKLDHQGLAKERYLQNDYDEDREYMKQDKKRRMELNYSHGQKYQQPGYSKPYLPNY